MTQTTFKLPKVVSQDEWLAARKRLLVEERKVTHANDAVSAKRRELPWVQVEKEYVFDTPDGKQTLAGLFDGRSQLIVYHFMFGPDWEEGCPSCSFLCDHVDGVNLHLANHDVTLLAVSRAPLAKLAAYKRRMNWRFRWVSSHGSTFNSDYHVSFTKDDIAKAESSKEGLSYNYEPCPPTSEGECHGISVFYQDENGDVFHTYSAYARGCDILIGAHNFLDLTPKGRNEKSTMDWVRRHDQYDDAGLVQLNAKDQT